MYMYIYSYANITLNLFLLPICQEREAFYSTQIGRSVQEGISSVTVFHERTPSEPCRNFCQLKIPPICGATYGAMIATVRVIGYRLMAPRLFKELSKYILRHLKDRLTELGGTLVFRFFHSYFLSLSMWSGFAALIEDVLEWLKDWGNQFNKNASKASFVEHLLSLEKIEPALQGHLESFSPAMTSTHKDYERVVRQFTEAKFPSRFGSYREYQNASAFRRRMLEFGLWSEFISYCNNFMDFQAAGDMDSGNIYKVCNAVSRKLLAYVSLARFLQAFMFSGDVSSWSCLKLNTSGFNFVQAAESRLYFIASRKIRCKIEDE